MGEDVGWWWYFQPAFNCPWEVERVGKFSRGGLWACGLSLYESQQQQQYSKPCVVYSMTKGTSTLSFELDLANRAGCDVWIYAPSLPSRVTGKGFLGRMCAKVLEARLHKEAPFVNPHAYCMEMD
jgi:hypothetical protein